MATFRLFDAFMEAGFKTVDLTDTNGLYWELLASEPSASDLYADLDLLPAGNGYTGGTSLAPDIISSGATGGIFSWEIGPVSITASGGPIGPFRYMVLETQSPLPIGWLDYGTDYTLPDGQTFTIAGGIPFTATKSA